MSEGMLPSCGGDSRRGYAATKAVNFILPQSRRVRRVQRYFHVEMFFLGVLRISAVNSFFDRYASTGKFARTAKTFNHSHAKWHPQPALHLRLTKR
jgi:hypothetical protein